MNKVLLMLVFLSTVFTSTSFSSEEIEVSKRVRVDSKARVVNSNGNLIKRKFLQKGKYVIFNSEERLEIHIVIGQYVLGNQFLKPGVFILGDVKIFVTLVELVIIKTDSHQPEKTKSTQTFTLINIGSKSTQKEIVIYKSNSGVLTTERITLKSLEYLEEFVIIVELSQKGFSFIDLFPEREKDWSEFFGVIND